MALLASASDKGDERILGKDDLEYATALSRAGYPDLAQMVLDAYGRAKGGGADVGLRAVVIQLQLKVEEAYRQADSLQRVELLSKVAEDMETFVKSHTGSEAAGPSM